MKILGIESSCDETAVGIVCDDAPRILAHALASQENAHRPYGGVVPEIAARAHLAKIDDLVRQALAEASLTLADIDGIAATCGPGLIGGVMVGAMMGKAMAAVTEKPFIAVNHLEAHGLSIRLSEDVPFPYLLLLISGGHCQLLWVKGVGAYELLGASLDDAVGECFDKSAKLLGLGYPGGVLIEKAAKEGNPNAIPLPRPLIGRKGCDFSFSGLKTAVRLAVEAQEKPLTSSFIADMAASLEQTIAAILQDRAENALSLLETRGDKPAALVAAGGVAANLAIRQALTSCAARHKLPFLAPPPALCTDNGLMIAWAGLERLRLGLSDPLDTRARPRWPLAPKQLGEFPDE
ncbi:MAG: tRNA (adenosine(37)-N6)-threonylcarbamoyltransferase complex transferase subunit TsaD [Alphaproteobacteria bacterium]|nr:tRNA (adenosine(37)-N6)-threonylcarbamoyltransferase complex transferase subunit TsaD [Alphaproteobacteria bacterium]